MYVSIFLWILSFAHFYIEISILMYALLANFSDNLQLNCHCWIWRILFFFSFSFFSMIFFFCIFPFAVVIVLFLFDFWVILLPTAFYFIGLCVFSNGKPNLDTELYMIKDLKFPITFFSFLSKLIILNTNFIVEYTNAVNFKSTAMIIWLVRFYCIVLK